MEAEVIFQFPIERVVCRKRAKVIGPFEEIVVALANWIRQATGPPSLFGGDLGFAIGDEGLYFLPSRGSVILIQHRAEDCNEFVVAQVGFS
jgi:hypothetical protein